MRQTWILFIISILLLLALQSCSCSWDTWYWCFDLARKAFLSAIFHIIKVHREMRQTWILLIISAPFVVGTPVIFILLGYMILVLWFGKKSFSLHHYPYNYTSLSTGTNLDALNNLHSFRYWHPNHVHLIRIHDIGALIW